MSKLYKILSIDPGVTTGIALGRITKTLPDDKVRCEILVLDQLGEMKMYDHLAGLLNECDVVIYEGFYNSGPAMVTKSLEIIGAMNYLRRTRFPNLPAKSLRPGGMEFGWKRFPEAFKERSKYPHSTDALGHLLTFAHQEFGLRETCNIDTVSSVETYLGQ